MKNHRREIVQALAEAFLAGTWHVRSLMARGDSAVGAGGTWLSELAFAVMQQFREPPLDQVELLADFIATDRFFQNAWTQREIPRRRPRFVLFHPRMGPRRWPVPKLDTVGDVSAWLGVDDAFLSWFADRRGLERVANDEALRHYRRRWVQRGERLPRLLEAPKDRLKAMQARHLTYSRYADDLVFSGAASASIGGLMQQVMTVVRDEGFRLNAAKTRVMRAETQQRVTGVVVNQKPNVSRAQFDALKALLHRCRQRGPLSQSTGPLVDFRASLQGQVSWVAQLNPTRGAKLQRELDALTW